MKRVSATVLLAALLLAAFQAPRADARTLAVPAAREPGAVRVVLTWLSDCDLDLHVVHPLDGERVVHAWESKAAAGGPAVRLDASPGPAGTECALIQEPDDGIYQFYVHDRSCRHGGEGGLGHTGAAVRVAGPRSERAYAPPAGARGNLWGVCAFQREDSEALGSVTWESDPSRVGERPDSALLPGDILLGSIPDSLVPGRWSHVALYAGDGRIVEAPSEHSAVMLRDVSDWTAPALRWVRYLRVTTADRATRDAAVRFALEQERAGKRYDIGFHAKQVDGDRWYCSELVWAAYMKASDGSVDLERTPDRLGVYPWEIAGDDDVAVIGGHYEERPNRSMRVVKLALETAWDHLSDWAGDVFGSGD